jgi:hypothetical protein
MDKWTNVQTDMTKLIVTFYNISDNSNKVFRLKMIDKISMQDNQN